MGAESCLRKEYAVSTQHRVTAGYRCHWGDVHDVHTAEFRAGHARSVTRISLYERVVKHFHILYNIYYYALPEHSQIILEAAWD